jgi:hypothetical protein
MHPDAPWFDDPERTRHRPGLRKSKKLAKSGLKQTKRRGSAKFENNDACRSRWVEPRYLTEIVIERYEHSSFCDTDLENPLVRRALEFLIANCQDVAASLPEQVYAAAADILVCLDLQAAGSVDTGIILSRAASAPYAIAARTS